MLRSSPATLNGAGVKDSTIPPLVGSTFLFAKMKITN